MLLKDNKYSQGTSMDFQCKSWICYRKIYSSMIKSVDNYTVFLFGEFQKLFHKFRNCVALLATKYILFFPKWRDQECSNVSLLLVSLVLCLFSLITLFIYNVHYFFNKVVNLIKIITFLTKYPDLQYPIKKGTISPQ